MLGVIDSNVLPRNIIPVLKPSSTRNTLEPESDHWWQGDGLFWGGYLSFREGIQNRNLKTVETRKETWNILADFDISWRLTSAKSVLCFAFCHCLQKHLVHNPDKNLLSELRTSPKSLPLWQPSPHLFLAGKVRHTMLTYEKITSHPKPSKRTLNKGANS